MTESTDVIVIGGGYAGALAASRLTRHHDLTVTLINPREAFVDRIRLHQRVAGTHDALIDLRKVVARRVNPVVDTATRIDASSRTVTLASGGSIGYDYLVYAVGSTTAEPIVPGASEFALPIASLESADRLRATLDRTPTEAPVTVVGAGPTGIETSAELAEQGRNVTLVCGGDLGPYLHPRARRSTAARLAKLGVAVVRGAAAAAVTRDAVMLDDGRRLASAVTIWAAGFAAPDLAFRSGLSTDALGRLRTDETLTSVDDDRIVATGDAAAPSDEPFRMSCQAAVQLGPWAADTVRSRIDGEQPASIAVGLAAQCISLGRGAGIYQFARRSDEAVGAYIGGWWGARVKEGICSGIVQMLRLEARRPGTLGYPRWVQDPARRGLDQARRSA